MLVSFSPKQCQQLCLYVIACQTSFLSYLFKHLQAEQRLMGGKGYSAVCGWGTEFILTRASRRIFSYSSARTREWTRIVMVKHMLHVLRRQFSSREIVQLVTYSLSTHEELFRLPSCVKSPGVPVHTCNPSAHEYLPSLLGKLHARERPCPTKQDGVMLKVVLLTPFTGLRTYAHSPHEHVTFLHFCSLHLN